MPNDLENRFISIDLCIAALNRAKEAKSRFQFINHLDTAILELGELVSMEDVSPTEKGISNEAMAVVIQLKMMSRLIQLNTNPRGKK
jgi:hypothetical protein